MTQSQYSEIEGIFVNQQRNIRSRNYKKKIPLNIDTLFLKNLLNQGGETTVLIKLQNT